MCFCVSGIHCDGQMGFCACKKCSLWMWACMCVCRYVYLRTYICFLLLFPEYLVNRAKKKKGEILARVLADPVCKYVMINQPLCARVSWSTLYR